MKCNNKKNKIVYKKYRKQFNIAISWSVCILNEFKETTAEKKKNI